MIPPRNCILCGAEFVPHYSASVTCSKRCYRRAWGYGILPRQRGAQVPEDDGQPHGLLHSKYTVVSVPDNSWAPGYELNKNDVGNCLHYGYFVPGMVLQAANRKYRVMGDELKRQKLVRAI